MGESFDDFIKNKKNMKYILESMCMPGFQYIFSQYVFEYRDDSSFRFSIVVQDKKSDKCHSFLTSHSNNTSMFSYWLSSSMRSRTIQKKKSILNVGANLAIHDILNSEHKSEKRFVFGECIKYLSNVFQIYDNQNLPRMMIAFEFSRFLQEYRRFHNLVEASYVIDQ